MRALMILWIFISVLGVNFLTMFNLTSQQKNYSILSQAPPTCDLSWKQVTMPVTQTILSADFVTSDEGWAVGFDGILRWKSGKWSLYAQPQNIALHSIRMLSANNGWIAGSGGTILHWDGVDWKKVDSSTTQNLWGLSFTSEKQGWAVGGDWEPGYRGEAPSVNHQHVVIEWDGQRWKTDTFSPVSPNNIELFSIAMVTPKAGWAVGDSGLYSWNGNQWVYYHLQNDIETNYGFPAITASDENDLWMIGNDYSLLTPQSPLPGRIFHWNGTQWNIVKQTDTALYSMAMPNSRFGLIGGGDNLTILGSSILLCWDQKEWREIPSPAIKPIQYIWAKSPTEAWIFSGGNSPSGGTLGSVFRSVPKSELMVPSTTISTVQATFTSIERSTASPVAERMIQTPQTNPTSAPQEISGSFGDKTTIWAIVISVSIILISGFVILFVRKKNNVNAK
jgi:hypothetical protein